MTLKRVLYQYENVAKFPVNWANKRTLYQNENIAKYGPDWTNQRAFYQYQNITSDPPTPYIGNISTRRAPAGSVIKVTGNGFGAKYQSDSENVDRSLRGYGGYVYIGSQICNIISWTWTEITFQLPVEAITGAIKVRLTVPTTRDSNLIGFEVYETTPANDIGLELFICDKSNPNTILCQLDGAKGKAFQSLLNNPGSGQFSISRYDPKGSNRDYIKDQNFVLCRLDGVDVFKWIIEGRSPSYVSADEQQMIGISGRGVLAMLEWAVVYPSDIGTPVLDRAFSGNAGAILRTLIIEAQARGCIPGVSVEWTATNDSIGNSFDDTTNITFHVGTPVSEVAKKFSDGLGLFDIEMTPDLKLRLYKIKGEDKYDTVKYMPGQAITSHQNQSNASKVVNEVLVEGKDGVLAIADHPTSQVDWGRREGYLQASNISDGLSEYGQRFLDKAAYAEWGIQGQVTKFTDSQGNIIKPFETFLNGDWIGWLIPPEGADTVGFDGKLRVKGITVEEDDETGDLGYTLELNNIMLENEIKVAQAVERLSGFSQNDVLANPSNGGSSGTGTDGLSAYQIAVNNGFTGTEAEWLASLVGNDGYTPIKGTDYFDGTDGADGKGISSIVRTSGTGAPGTTDTYTITFTDNTSTTFNVYNGADGSGSGGGTPKDRIYVPNGADLGYDDEFDDGVIDSDWVSIDVSGKENLWYEPSGIKGLSCYAPSDKGGFKLCGKLKSLGDMTYPMYIETAYKLQGRSAGYPHAGVMFSDSNVLGNGLQIYCGYNGYHNKMFWGKQTNFTIRTSYGEYDMLPYATTDYVHIRLVWVAANTFSIYYSMDGVVWILAYENLSYSMTPSYFGICENTEDNSTYPVLINYAYFRVRAGLPVNG
jgi:hypothetical protein